MPEIITLSGAEAADLFEKQVLIDYLFENFTELHTQAREYIIPLLHDFVNKKEARA